MTTNSGPRAYSTRRTRAGLELALGSVARPNPLVIVWRWRYELGLALFLAIVVLALTSAVGLWWGLATISIVSGLTAAWPAARRQIAVRAWCIITPHRVRTGCAQAWIHSRRGKIPVVVFTTAEPFGERVYLWLRAGVGAEDLMAARQLLAAACWANDVNVAPHERYAHLVALDVIRRPSTHPAEDEWLDLAEPPSWPHGSTPRQKLAERCRKGMSSAGRERRVRGYTRSRVFATAKARLTSLARRRTGIASRSGGGVLPSAQPRWPRSHPALLRFHRNLAQPRV
jgi:hypothetical protein